jgi:hypothetical protein
LEFVVAAAGHHRDVVLKNNYLWRWWTVTNPSGGVPTAEPETDTALVCITVLPDDREFPSQPDPASARDTPHTAIHRGYVGRAGVRNPHTAHTHAATVSTRYTVRIVSGSTHIR